MSKRTLHFGGPLLILCSCILWSSCGFKRQPKESNWHKVDVVRTSRTLTEIGTLEARELTLIQTQVSGNVSEVVENGSQVRKGDVLVRLDDEELRSKLDDEILNLEQIKEDLETEWSEYSVLTNSFSMTSQLKIAERDHAELELITALVTLTPEQRRLLEIDIALAELDLLDQSDQYRREAELVQKGFAPASSLESILREKEAAETFVEEKKTQLEIEGLPLPEEERLTLETAVANATQAVLRNEAQQKRDLDIQDLTIEGLNLKIKHSEEYIARLNQELTQVELIAPVDGIIRLTQNWHWSIRGWLPLSPGQRIHDLDMAGTIVDPEDLSLRIIVHESDFPLLKVGQGAIVKLTSFPDDEVKGTLISLTALGQDRNDLSPLYRQAPAVDQAMFLASISLEELNEKAMPGMTATAEIEIEALRELWVIPIQAVYESDSRYQVTLRRDGKVQENVVIEGIQTRDGTLFEVTQGLQIGDEVRVRSTKP